MTKGAAICIELERLLQAAWVRPSELHDQALTKLIDDALAEAVKVPPGAAVTIIWHWIDTCGVPRRTGHYIVEVTGKQWGVQAAHFQDGLWCDDPDDNDLSPGGRSRVVAWADLPAAPTR